MCQAIANQLSQNAYVSALRNLPLVSSPVDEEGFNITEETRDIRLTSCGYVLTPIIGIELIAAACFPQYGLAILATIAAQIAFAVFANVVDDAIGSWIANRNTVEAFAKSKTPPEGAKQRAWSNWGALKGILKKKILTPQNMDSTAQRDLWLNVAPDNLKLLKDYGFDPKIEGADGLAALGVLARVKKEDVVSSMGLRVLELIQLDPYVALEKNRGWFWNESVASTLKRNGVLGLKGLI